MKHIFLIGRMQQMLIHPSLSSWYDIEARSKFSILVISENSRYSFYSGDNMTLFICVYLLKAIIYQIVIF